jgi:uncharacterized membrane protein YedE/YeeE
MNFFPYSIVVVVVSLFAAALLGFAAHRASFCTVKAVAEILSTRRAYMLTSFAKIALWVSAIALPLSWLAPPIVLINGTWAFGTPALVGGALFGIGAAMNGGCAFYTLTRLTSGNLALLFTLAGFVVGYFLQLRFVGDFTSPAADPIVTLYDQPGVASLAWLALIWLALVREIRRLWRSRQSGTWKEQLFAERYRLSFAAILFGIANGLLFVFWGQWAYTSALREQVVSYQGLSMGPTVIQVGLFIAVLVGMMLSARQRGVGRVTFGQPRFWIPHLAGGTLMGLGAAVAPGGNDALLLYGIPMFSPHALPAFSAMLMAIGVALLLGKLFAGLNFRTECWGDVYWGTHD